MARLTDQEREALQRLANQDRSEPIDIKRDYIVDPTVEGRSRYIDFATEASKIYRGDRPVHFRGNNWKL